MPEIDDLLEKYKCPVEHYEALEDSRLLDVVLDPEGPFIVFGREKHQGSEEYVFVDGCVTRREQIRAALGEKQGG